MIGRTLSHYKVLEEISRGGMGIVYKALDLKLNREVALKVLPPQIVSDPDRKRRFVQEAQAAAALKHPSIAVVHEIDEVEGETFIAMELIEGEKLSSILERGPLAAERAVQIAVEVSEGLAKAHEKGIVHRDLKPGNVMITEDGHAKIIDFGLAKLLERLGSEDSELQTVVRDQTRSEVLLGTVSYMSPEQARGLAVDHRTDIFSFGIVLYEMLTGQRPFQAPSAPEILHAVIHDAVAIPSLALPELERAVEKCLAKSPDARYQDVNELFSDLIAVKRIVDSGMMPAPVRSRRRLFRWVVVGLGVLALVIFLLLWPRARPSEETANERTTLAVLFFDNLSKDSSLAWLRTGLTEIVVTHLQRSTDLDVFGTDDLYEILKETNHLDEEAASLEVLQEVARRADAELVISGSFMKTGNTIRISTRLREVDSGNVLGVETVEGVGEASIFPMADELSRRILARFEGAESSEGAVALPTSSVEAFADYTQARTFLERSDVSGNLDRAMQLFQSAIQKDPGFALAHAGLGRTYWAIYGQTLDQTWTDKAREAVMEALRIDPDQAQVRLSLAVILEGSGRREEAKEELRRTLVLAPESDDAHRRLGLILSKEGRTDEAISELQKAIANRPSFWTNHSWLGLVYYRAGRYSEAIGAFRRVTELQPDSSSGFQMLGTVYHTMGELDRALENYEKAIRLGPSRGSYTNIGTIKYYQGKYDEAAEAYQKAIAIGTALPLNHRNLGDAYMRLGETEKARESYHRAVELSEDMLEVNPKDAAVLSSLAMYEAKLGRVSDAKRHSEEALALSPNDPDVLFDKAVVSTLTGDLTEALFALEKALERGYSVRLAEEDDELGPLRSLPEFQAILNRAR